MLYSLNIILLKKENKTQKQAVIIPATSLVFTIARHVFTITTALDNTFLLHVKRITASPRSAFSNTEGCYQYSNIYLRFSFFFFLLWLSNHAEPTLCLFWCWLLNSPLFPVVWLHSTISTTYLITFVCGGGIEFHFLLTKTLLPFNKQNVCFS